MYWEISLSAVTAYLVVSLTPWRRVADQACRCVSRAQRRLSALAEHKFGQKTAHLPQHKPKRR